MIVLVLGSSSTYSPHINHSGQDSLTKIIFRAPIFRSGLEARSNKKQQYKSGRYKMQTADCRPGTKCTLGTKCRLQTGYKMQTENVYFFLGPQRSGVYTHWFAHMCLILLLVYMRNRPTNTHTPTKRTLPARESINLKIARKCDICILKYWWFPIAFRELQI